MLMVHLDDPQEPIREHVTAVLTIAAEVSPRLLVQECQAARCVCRVLCHRVVDRMLVGRYTSLPSIVTI